MRIAHVTDCYLPRMGGIERQVHDLALRQQSRGDEVTVFTSVAAPGPAAGVGAVVRPRSLRGATSSRIRYEATWSGLRALRAGRFDAVHVHASGFSPLAFAAARDSCRSDVPTVFTLHSLLGEATPVFRCVRALLAARGWPLRWSAVSSVAAASLRGGIGPGIPIAVVPNAVEPAEWRTQRRDREPGAALRVVTVGRLAARKRPRQLARLLAHARDLLPAAVPLEAVLVGDGPQRAALQRWLSARGLGWITLAGPLDRDEIRAVHATADLYLAPATRESFGIAALEARCAGLPVIARAGTGIADFVEHGRHGRLVASDAEMAATVADLALDPASLAQLQDRVRLSPPPTSWAQVLARYDALYGGADAHHPRPGIAARLMG